jgi:hypothetical protein
MRRADRIIVLVDGNIARTEGFRGVQQYTRNVRFHRQAAVAMAEDEKSGSNI